MGLWAHNPHGVAGIARGALAQQFRVQVRWKQPFPECVPGLGSTGHSRTLWPEPLRSTFQRGLQLGCTGPAPGPRDFSSGWFPDRLTGNPSLCSHLQPTARRVD